MPRPKQLPVQVNPTWPLAQQTVLIAGTTAVGAGAAFFAWRYSERRRLVWMLSQSALVTQGRVAGVISWTDEEKAAEELGWFSVEPSAAAFLRITNHVRELLPEKSAVTASSVVADVAQAAGLDRAEVERALESGGERLKALYDRLPDVPGVDIASWLRG